MTDKTSSGRSKNVSCPHCEQMFYSVHTLNVHIAYKHPGERTVRPGAEPKRLTPYKAAPQRTAPAPKREVREYDEEEADEDDDEPY